MEAWKNKFRAAAAEIQLLICEINDESVSNDVARVVIEAARSIFILAIDRTTLHRYVLKPFELLDMNPLNTVTNLLLDELLASMKRKGYQQRVLDDTVECKIELLVDEEYSTALIDIEEAMRQADDDKPLVEDINSIDTSIIVPHTGKERKNRKHSVECNSDVKAKGEIPRRKEGIKSHVEREEVMSQADDDKQHIEDTNSTDTSIIIIDSDNNINNKSIIISEKKNRKHVVERNSTDCLKTKYDSPVNVCRRVDDKHIEDTDSAPIVIPYVSDDTVDDEQPLECNDEIKPDDDTSSVIARRSVGDKSPIKCVEDNHTASIVISQVCKTVRDISKDRQDFECNSDVKSNDKVSRQRKSFWSSSDDLTQSPEAQRKDASLNSVSNTQRYVSKSNDDVDSTNTTVFSKVTARKLIHNGDVLNNLLNFDDTMSKNDDDGDSEHEDQILDNSAESNSIFMSGCHVSESLSQVPKNIDKPEKELVKESFKDRKSKRLSLKRDSLLQPASKKQKCSGTGTGRDVKVHGVSNRQKIPAASEARNLFETLNSTKNSNTSLSGMAPGNTFFLDSTSGHCSTSLDSATHEKPISDKTSAKPNIARDRCGYKTTEKSGKIWRRKHTKREILCPLCPAKTQWVTRHLRQRHKMSKAEAKKALSHSPSYRRRNLTNSASWRPRRKCPINDCNEYVVQLNSHLHRKHNTTAKRLGVTLKKSENSVSLSSLVQPITRSTLKYQYRRKYPTDRYCPSQLHADHDLERSSTVLTVLTTSESLAEYTLSSSNISGSVSTNAKVPSRKSNADPPCLFCGVFEANLKRHLLLAHKNKELVIVASNIKKKVVRDAVFEKIRKLGIYEFNKNELRNERSGTIERQHSSCKSNESVVYCEICYGFYSAGRFATYHKISCLPQTKTNGVDVSKPTGCDMLNMTFDLNEDFTTEILSKFKNNKIDFICQRDKCIVLYGLQMYQKLMQQKREEILVGQLIVQDMRQIADLYLEFKSICDSVEPVRVKCAGVADMLVRGNFDYLQEAILGYSIADEWKSPLNNTLSSLFLKLAKIQKAIYFATNQDNLVREIDNFTDIFRLCETRIKENFSRDHWIKLRRSADILQDTDVVKLKSYTIQRLKTILADHEVSDWDGIAFVELRDLTVSHLTLFNVNHGGEPARLTLNDWKDAERATMIDQSLEKKTLDEVEARLFSDVKVTRQCNQQTRQNISIIFPSDCHDAMNVLSNEVIRRTVDVHVDNVYMFPCLQESNTYASCWHAVTSVCKDAQIANSELFIATKVRRRISTIYAGVSKQFSHKNHMLVCSYEKKRTSANNNQVPTGLGMAAILQRAEVVTSSNDSLFSDAAIPVSPLAVNDKSSSLSEAAALLPVTCNPLTDHITQESPAMKSTVCQKQPSDGSTNLKNVDAGGSLERIRSKPSPYMRWTVEENKKFHDFFKEWLDGDCHLGKAKIVEFKELHPELPHTWKKIRSKIDNEKRNASARANKQQNTENL